MAMEVDLDKKENPPTSQTPQIRLSGALLPFALFLQPKKRKSEPHFEDQSLPPSISLSCSLPLSVIYPLSPLVCNLLGVTEERSSFLASAVVGRVLSGVPVWESVSRAVIQVGENVVVKGKR